MRRVLADVISAAKQDDTIFVGCGFGLNFRMLGFGRKFVPLNLDRLNKAYRSSTRRLIVLDYSGTLTEEEPMDQYMKAAPLRDGTSGSGSTRLPGLTKELRNALARLCAKPNNDLYIISGSDGTVLAHALSGIPRVGVAGQHGFMRRAPGSSRWKRPGL